MFIISQDFYEITKGTIRANGNIYQMFKPNISIGVKNPYRDEASMEMTPNEFKYLTNIFWDEQ